MLARFPYSGDSQELAPTSLCSSYAQSKKQSAASITLIDLNDGIHGDMFMRTTSIVTIGYIDIFPSLLVIHNIPRL